jgi:uncharacterized protein (DUF2164 family)
MDRNDIDREKKKQCIEEIKAYFENERDEMIGDMAAELILGFFLDKIAPVIYNQALEDAHRFLSDKLDDLYGMEK